MALDFRVPNFITSIYTQVVLAFIAVVLIYRVFAPELIDMHSDIALWAAVVLMFAGPVVLLYLVWIMVAQIMGFRAKSVPAQPIQP